jgi:hypothetical protein
VDRTKPRTIGACLFEGVLMGRRRRNESGKEFEYLQQKVEVLHEILWDFT